MSDTRLRELERRWQETGAPEDWAAYVRESLRTGHGVVDEALALLARARAFAEKIADLGPRGAALAKVAWAYAELAHGVEALEVVDLARAAVGNREDPESLTARMRIGAVQERTQGSGEGRAQLEGALSVLRQSATPELLAAWLVAAADALPGRADDPLVRGAWGLVAERYTEEQLEVLERSGTAAVRLGLETRLRELVVRELARDDLQAEELEGLLSVNLGLDPPAVSPSHALRRLREEQGWSLKKVLRATVRACGPAAWDEVQAWIEELRAAEDEFQDHAAQIVELEALSGLAEAGDPRVAARLPAALSEAWTSENEMQRLKVVSHLVALVPLLSLPGGRGVGLLREANLRTEQEGRQVRLELLEAVAKAAAACGAFDLVEKLVDAALEIHRAASPTDAHTWRVCIVWRACLGIASLRERARSRALIARVAEAASAALDDPSAEFYAEVLLHCGSAALVLHERQLATECFGEALAKVAELDVLDQRSVLLLASLETSEMQDPIRYGLARSLLDTAEVVGVLKRSGDALQLVELLCTGLVRPPT